MTSTRLELYNLAALHCSERPIADLSENTSTRKTLDHAYNAGSGLVTLALEEGLWNFAMRTVEIFYTPSVEPPFGYARAFEKPVDLVRTAAICEDEYFANPKLRYADESGYWFADEDSFYVKYVSNDASYGGDISKWPSSFVEAAGLLLAERAAHGFNRTHSEIAALNELREQQFVKARSRDAMSDSTKFLPQGNWTRSRRAQGRTDRGNRNQLIG